MNRKLLYVFIVMFIGVVLGTTEAWAADDVPPVSHSLLLASQQFWAGVLGSIAPLIAYVINHRAPWISEKAKVLVQVVIAAAAGAIYELIVAGDFKFDTAHLEVVGAAVFGALFAHHAIYKPGHISAALGGGSNIQDNPRR